MAEWAKKDEALIERVDGLLAAAPVRRKRLFGINAWFLEWNDTMFVCTQGEGIMVRVGAERTANLIESGEAEAFDPMGGSPLREYVFLNGDRIAEDGVLLDWLEQASVFAADLPPKKKNAKAKKRR